MWVPSGFTVRARPHPFMKDVKNGFLKDLRCARLLDLDRAQLDVGTLGGGNHFIELDRADGGGLWLVVHSGSRHTGLLEDTSGRGSNRPRSRCSMWAAGGRDSGC